MKCVEKYQKKKSLKTYIRKPMTANLERMKYKNMTQKLALNSASEPPLGSR
jgi:hypothetical protein